MIPEQIEAVYEGGVLRPLQSVDLAESQRVTITISSGPVGHSTRDWGAVEMARAAIAHLDRIPTIEEVREALSVIPGSMAEDLIADRGEY